MPELGVVVVVLEVPDVDPLLAPELVVPVVPEVPLDFPELVPMEVVPEVPEASGVVVIEPELDLLVELPVVELGAEPESLLLSWPRWRPRSFESLSLLLSLSWP